MEILQGFSGESGEKKPVAPENDILHLKEKILVFGSWDSFSSLRRFSIDLPDGRKITNGRIVIIKSTGHVAVKTEIANSSISRILSAKDQWAEVLSCASNDDLEIIISNKRIVRKDVLRDNINLVPPFSFPGKLLAILFKRFEFYNAAPDKGLIVFCVEQDQDNTNVLQTILLELAHLNNLQPSFLDWIENSNHFFNKCS